MTTASTFIFLSEELDMIVRAAGLVLMAFALLLEIVHVVSLETYFASSSYEFHHKVGITFLTGLFIFLWELNGEIKPEK